MITQTQYTDALERGYHQAQATLAASRGPDGKLPHHIALQLPIDAKNAAAQVYTEQTRSLGGERTSEAQALQWVETLAAHPWTHSDDHDMAATELGLLPATHELAENPYMLDTSVDPTAAWELVAGRDRELMTDIRHGLDDIAYNQRIRDREHWTVGGRHPDRINVTLTVEQADELCTALAELSEIHAGRLENAELHFHEALDEDRDESMVERISEQLDTKTRIEALEQTIISKLDVPKVPAGRPPGRVYAGQISTATPGPSPKITDQTPTGRRGTARPFGFTNPFPRRDGGLDR